MQLFDIDYIDQLSEQQVRYLLRSELERNKLLIRKNHVVMFRYEVRDDAMILLKMSDEGELQHVALQNYTRQATGILFDTEEHTHVKKIIHCIVNDPDYPKTGTFESSYHDGTRINVEYACMLDADGQAMTIVGQLSDAYQTHEHMVATIKMLNEQVTMTDAIRQSYETMILFDIRDYSFTLIQGTPEVQMAAKAVKTVLQLAGLFCQHYVDENYQQGFMDFVNEGTIEDRLQGNRFISFEYMTRNIGWCRARIMPADMDSSGQVTKAIFTTETAADHHEELSVLRVAASKDALTGLDNRYSGWPLVQQTLEEGKPCVMALMDCDSFKNINDKLGHPTGDKVLQEVARALTDVFAPELVMRLGGDEFVVMISNPVLVDDILSQGFEPQFGQLRARLQQIEIPQLKGQKPSLSCGCVIIQGGKHQQKDVYETADHHLYIAKASHNGALSSIRIG